LKECVVGHGFSSTAAVGEAALLRDRLTCARRHSESQKPAAGHRAEVVPLRQGDAVAFAVHNRPVKGTKGNYRVNLRHGVSRIRSGLRHTVGIIFHDAK
jgi:hypothetical protein